MALAGAHGTASHDICSSRSGSPFRHPSLNPSEIISKQAAIYQETGILEADGPTMAVPAIAIFLFPCHLCFLYFLVGKEVDVLRVLKNTISRIAGHLNKNSNVDQAFDQPIRRSEADFE